MNKLFYPRLSFNNMKKNSKFYLPYMITCIVTVAMYYIMCSVAWNEGIKNMPDQASLRMILEFGSRVIGIFAVIFLFYTNSFLMKRRKKELGLYNILGMEKRHISKVLFLETVYLSIVSLAAGLLMGILLDKLIILFLYHILSFSVPIGFSISGKGIFNSLVLFTCIFFLILISNLIQIGRTKPIDLLHGENIGEKEPKAKWLLALAGVITIGAAYYIAITTKSPIDAIGLFFVAVILVIVGTYCLFTAGSIVVLKLLKKNTKYYYQTKHFISVSGMMYRMKQNAVGLANICILSTMVLVMVSTTVSLYVGLEEELDTRYPYDITVHYESEHVGFDKEEILSTINHVVEKQGRTITNMEDQLTLFFTLEKESEFSFIANKEAGSIDSMAIFYVYTEEQYAAMIGKKPQTLGEEEVRIYGNDTKVLSDKLSIMGTDYTIKEKLKSFPRAENMSYMAIDVYYVVVSDDMVLQNMYQQEKEVYGKDVTNKISYEVFIDIDGSKEEKIDCANSIFEASKEKVKYTALDENGKEVNDFYTATNMESKQSEEDGFYGVYGGFLFLGIFLGILFLMVTTLIIYYKQISEGYEDKGKFEIMEKVGMTKEEVRTSIRSQVLKIFFLPIVAAGIHVAAAFPMITRLLVLFNLTNTTLFIWCTVGTIVVFAAIYGIVYALTARVYYKIVS